MNIGLLIVTHDNIGHALIESATTTLGMCPLALELVSVTTGCDPDGLERKTCAAVKRLNKGHGVLVLTDMYGSTPSNVANRLRCLASVRVVAGINLPMLIRVLNYPNLTLDEIAYKAMSGGRDGIFVCDNEH